MIPFSCGYDEAVYFRFAQRLPELILYHVITDLKMKAIIDINRHTNIWVKVFKNGSSKIYGRQPIKI